MGGLSQGVEEEAVAGIMGAHDGQRKGSQGSLEESTPPGLRKPQGEGSSRSPPKSHRTPPCRRVSLTCLPGVGRRSSTATLSLSMGWAVLGPG